MEPRKLLQALLNRDGDSPTSLARKLPDGPSQPQIHKFLRGVAREPKRATLAPLAAHFSIPLDAFYSNEVAERTANELGLGPTPSGIAEPKPAPAPIAINADKAVKWPFRLVTYRRLRALPAEAIADIDANLDILVERWERSGNSKKPNQR